MKVLALLSGGLDSQLAIRIVQEQNVFVAALNFQAIFCDFKTSQIAQNLKVPLEIIEITEELMEVVKKPKFGYGQGMNPCIDCRILMLRKAKELLQKNGTGFIITGEVLGERPMSQRLETMKLIEREAGLERLILRPLSAQLLEETIPEEKGWVDRSKLYAIRGRSRKPQMELARQFNLNHYPNPAGGCLLTDQNFTQKMKNLLKFNASPELNDLQLLKFGRHFWFGEASWLIVGRNKEENEKITTLVQESDLILEAADWSGPTGLLRIRRGLSHLHSDEEKKRSRSNCP